MKVTVIGSHLCPDTLYALNRLVEAKADIDFKNLSASLPDLKAYLALRENSPVFDGPKARGSLGIPCFILEDGTVTLEEFAVWLLRAMDLEACAPAADETALDFGDAESIDPDKRPYVSLLASQGILAGDQNGNLSPKSPVTRARAAVLVARALRVLDSHGAAGMELPEYTSYGWTSGTLTAVEAGDGGVTLLDKLSAEEAENLRRLAAPAAEPGEKMGFQEALKKVLEQRNRQGRS